MESNKVEALRAKENAEKLFAERNFVGAKSFALRAQLLYPELDGITQMLSTFDVYIGSAVKVNGEVDYYSVLGMKPSSTRVALKKQYKKMAVLLHPDKNKSVGADGAFKLVSEAWTLLSDRKKRSAYDFRRNSQLSYGMVQTNLSSVHTGGTMGFEYSSQAPVSQTRLDTFWTLCTSCHVQYEYLRKYLNKKLSCKNCRGIFIAVETGKAPVSGSFPYSPWSYPDNGYNGHGHKSHNGITYVPTSAICFNGNGVSEFHSGHRSEFVPNGSYQWSSYPEASTMVDPHGFTSNSVYPVHQGNGTISKQKVNHKYHMKTAVADMGPGVSTVYKEASVVKLGRPAKLRKVDLEGTSQNGNEFSRRNEEDTRVVNGNGNTKQNSKICNLNEIPMRRCLAAPAFDARKLLIEKARTEIRKKLEEIKLASIAAKAAEHNKKLLAGSVQEPNKAGMSGPCHQLELKKAGSTSITVPDSDFHDFDKDRAEEYFKPKQIWALYDDEDGMPRLYCVIREIISVKPFKVHITYFNSKTDTEFGLVNWLDSGFTKSCGNFRATNTEVVEQVNIFSHHLTREKAGRGGCVRIYPRSGDIWAVYRNWSREWNRTTPDEVRHQYEMVEVLDDYSEELGVCVAPLVKLEGFKTVYQRNTDKSAIRWIPRREMLRFSHQVPSCMLNGESGNLPNGCWDLDPAATPEELLRVATEVEAEKNQSEAEN